MTAILEKRTSESLWYDIDCTDLLDAAETISSITGITADQAGLTFGIAVSNAAAVTYSDGRVAAIGKVLQVKISDGVIPSGAKLKDGRIGYQYTIRPKFSTSTGNTREPTVLLNVTDGVV